MFRQLFRRSTVVTFVLLALLAMGTVLAEGLLRTVLFGLLSGGGILASALYWPELLIMGYMFAGRFSFDPRLAPFDSSLSVNQMMLVGLAVVALVHWREMILSYRNWTLLTLLLFGLALVLGLGWTRGLNYGLYKVSRTWGVVVPGVVVAVAVIRARQSLGPLIAATFVVGFGLNSVALLTFEQSMGVNRLSSLGSGPITFARAVGAALMIATLSFVWFVQQKQAPRRVWYALLSLLCVGWLLPGFVLAQSRGPALALFVSVAAVLLLSMRGSWKTTLAGILLSGGGLWAAVWILQEVLGTSRFDVSKKANQAGVDGRVDHLWDTWELVVNHPVLGVGTGGWPVGVYGIDERAYPHNFFAEVASENGLPVAFALLGLFVLIALRSLRSWWYSQQERPRYLVLGALAAFLFFVVNISATGDSVDNRLIWLALAALEFSGRRAEREPGYMRPRAHLSRLPTLQPQRALPS